MRREKIKSKKVVVKLPEDYNLPDTFKRDSGGLEFAIRNKVCHLFVDMVNGKIWQFSAVAFNASRSMDLRKYFPHMRNCEEMDVKTYIKLTVNR